MTLSEKEYFVVFDTNVLYQQYNSKADFTSFAFNSTFNNVINIINELDIYEKVVLAIPNVIWSEMEKQIIDAHTEKVLSFKSYIEKWKLPEYSIIDNKFQDYPTFIKKIITAYKMELSEGINKVVHLQFPSKDCFDRIISRAFNKEPPFGGKEKNSDKGFKDVLLWESILEFISLHPNSETIFYTKDNGFKENLISEFKSIHQNANIIICLNENDVKSQLESWAKEIDIYSYQPLTEYNDLLKLIKWIESSNFIVQLIDRDFGLVENTHLITQKIMHLINYDNIQLNYESSDIKEYAMEAILEIEYTLINKLVIKSKMGVNISIECLQDEIYSVKDVHQKPEIDQEIEV